MATSTSLCFCLIVLLLACLSFSSAFQLTVDDAAGPSPSSSQGSQSGDSGQQPREEGEDEEGDEVLKRSVSSCEAEGSSKRVTGELKVVCSHLRLVQAKLVKAEEEIAVLKAALGSQAQDPSLGSKKLVPGLGPGEMADPSSAPGVLVQRRPVTSAAGRKLLSLSQRRGSHIGCTCEATSRDMARYYNYTVHSECPNDWFFVQRLIFIKNCHSLPRRRCRTPTPEDPAEPVPFPQSLFDQRALADRNVRWDLHECKSFQCLATRPKGDCLRCFNLTLEEARWKNPYRGTIPMREVMSFKERGALRLGLDVGGGTGSFAAHMARHGVTVMTTAYNVETTAKRWGVPYMEAIALRGLIPLHVSHHARLPFYHGTLDVIHAVNTVKAVTRLQFEEIVYEWDRVLRVGGLLWLEMFYAPERDMPAYVQIIQRLKYKKLYWNFTPKPDRGEWGGEKHVYLNCVLEKQPFVGTQLLDSPPAEDIEVPVAPSHLVD